MTFLELKTLVADWLDDTNYGYFTETQVERWINNAQIEAQKIIQQAFENQFEKCVETTLVQNQQEYQLPADFKKLVKLEYIKNTTTFPNEDPSQLGKITSSQRNRWERVGEPNAYYFKNNQLILVPAPDGTAGGKTLRMVYTYRLADMSNAGDVSDIPVEYHEYLAVLATLDGFAKDGRDPTTLMAKKAAYERDMKRDAEQRHIDAPRTVVQTEYDDFEGDYY